MQAMRKIFSIFAVVFLLFAGFSLYNSQNPNPLDAQALPSNVKPINLDEIKSFVSADSPKIIFLYASWCPYCKKQMSGFAYFIDQYPTDDIIAISTERDAEDFSDYVRNSKSFPFTPYIYTGKEDLASYIKKAGGSFSGGIPYFAVFHKGKFKQDFIGLTHPEELAKAIQ